ncbi:hypothetical protein R3P38DRAFT_2868556 [Favolaschia claudopus]|uniref:Cryptic POLO box 1 (CPB1) domain-containing protein n=1 Tax=Favolaschia claudopus TaxID=2862362 RepID=A0AAW0DBN5_9AGAR
MGHAKAKTSSFGFSRRKPPRRSYPEQKPSSSHEQSAARRVVSDPLPQATRFTSRVTASILLPSQNTNLQPQAESSSSSSRSQDRNVIHFATTSTGLTDTVPSPATIPVGTTRPLPITTSLLSPEVHKTVNGQITILQSHSLLVDFREGERRRGRQGTEVFVVNPQGTEIEVYDAPHLSLPCCLAEPNRKYTIENLPSTYWKQYNDASILVERIKQRTPKLILLTPTAKCLLMANTLPGDIELLFGSPLPHDRKSGTVLPTDATRMRIRLSRQTRTLEMAKHLSGARGEEWTKKVLTTTNEFPHVSSLDWDNMEADEREGIKDLTCFWRTCEAVEQSECASYSASHSCKSPASHSTNSRTSSTVPQINFLPNGPTWNLPASFSSTQTLPWMTVPLAPRPSKLPLIPANTCRKAAQQPPPSPSVLDIPSMEAQYPSVTGKTGILPTWCREDNNELTPAQHHFVSSQTKFIPTVGWCIRQSSRVSQGGRYKIMFFDGATLEIDVDEDWAELTGPNGGTTRHNIGDCNMKRHVAERMKVFGEFVSMFDETEEG